MFKKILFCTDFSQNSDYAFPYALNLAKTYKAKLLIFHVMVEETFYYRSSPESRDELKDKRIEFGRKEAMDRYAPGFGTFKDYEYLSCEAGESEVQYEIVQTAQKESVEVIVMGTHGRTGPNHLILGSTAESVAKKSPCPRSIATSKRKPGYSI
jgi:nucleotide-binding universal stress UspA family protein